MFIANQLREERTQTRCIHISCLWESERKGERERKKEIVSELAVTSEHWIPRERETSLVGLG